MSMGEDDTVLLVLHLSFRFYREILSSFMAGEELKREQCFNITPGHFP